MKRNFIYQVTYQILLVFLPFITTPYISRVLGIEGIGSYSYAYSTVSYFEIFAALGMALYGNRKISQVRGDVKIRDKTFWEIYSFRLLSSGIAILAYVIFVLTFHKENIIFYVCLIDIVGVALDVSWFFFGIEAFRFTTVQSLFVRLISVVAVFVLVHSPGDIWIYTAIVCFSNLLGQLILWSYIKKNIKFVRPSIEEIKQHVWPILLLFIPVLAISIYKLMDKIMLGAIANETEVGYYYSSEKVISIPTTVITALTTVMMPRITNLVVKKDKKMVAHLMNCSFDFMSCASAALCFGIAAVMPQFVPLFFGTGYEPCIVLITLLAPVTMICSFEQVIRTQYLTPNNCDKEYTISTFYGAGINLIFNVLLIPEFGARGAIVGTLAAELAVTLYQLSMVSRMFSLNRYISQYAIFASIGLVMCIAVRFLNSYLPIGVVSLIVEVLVGACIYISLSLPFMLKQKNVLWTYFIVALKKITIRL